MIKPSANSGQLHYASLTFAILAMLAGQSGCSNDHQIDRDGSAVDAQIDAHDPCTVAGIARCDSACGRNMSFCVQTETRREHCIAGLCLPTEIPEDPSGPQSSACSELGECLDSRVCVCDPVFGGGSCMPETFCDEAAREGYPVHCIWSGGHEGGTPRVTGAPHDASECPASAHAGNPMCGSPCRDGCTHYTSDNYLLNGGVCIGRSDTRQFGICTPDVLCARGRAGPEQCMDTFNGVAQIYPEFAGTGCACLVFRGESTGDGLSDFGFISTPEGCRGYRSMYPDDIDCVTDIDWHRLP